MKLFHRLILCELPNKKKYENTPLERFYNLLALDRKDVYQIFFYIFCWIKFVIAAWHSSYYKLFNLGAWVLPDCVDRFGRFCVALVGILSLMQLRITENLQQKIFVRSSLNLRLFTKDKKRRALRHPSELANRFLTPWTFKRTLKLLIDFSAAFVANYFHFAFLFILTLLFWFLLFLLLFLFLSFHINLV
jgi:hypothetical protein